MRIPPDEERDQFGPTAIDAAQGIEPLKPGGGGAIFNDVAVDEIRGAPSDPCMGLAGRFAFRRKRYRAGDHH